MGSGPGTQGKLQGFIWLMCDCTSEKNNGKKLSPGKWDIFLQEMPSCFPLLRALSQNTVVKGKRSLNRALCTPAVSAQRLRGRRFPVPAQRPLTSPRGGHSRLHLSQKLSPLFFPRGVRLPGEVTQRTLAL